MKILYDLGFNTSILTVPLEGFSYLDIGIPVFLLHPWKEDSGLEHEEHIFKNFPHYWTCTSIKRKAFYNQ